MIEKYYSSLPLYHFIHLSEASGVAHFISGRQGGVSKGEFESLNISQHTADSPENVEANRDLIAKVLGTTSKQMLFARQIHSDQVGLVDKMLATSPKEEQKAMLQGLDAIITQEQGVYLCVTAADCVPLLFYDTENCAVGAAHAGWRGTAKSIAKKTVQAMQDQFGTNPEELLVGIGPSISGEVYEVGPEVLDAMKKAMGNIEGLTSQDNASRGKSCLDLWEANRRQLLEAGISEGNIEVSGICTYKDQDRFFSARRNKGKGGRFCAGIGLG